MLLEERCAMGDISAMYEMFQKFRGQLSTEYLNLEQETEQELSNERVQRLYAFLKQHDEDCFFVRASNMWLNRAKIYGSYRAEEILKAHPFYAKNAYFSQSFMLPGNMQGRACLGEAMKKMGFLDFDGREKWDLYIRSLNERGLYFAEGDAGCDGPDETGFGMEEEYDFCFFDEFFRLLYVLHGWSRRDLNHNEGEIWKKCEAKRTELQNQREQFWKTHRYDMEKEKYHKLAAAR